MTLQVEDESLIPVVAVSINAMFSRSSTVSEIVEYRLQDDVLVTLDTMLCKNFTS